MRHFTINNVNESLHSCRKFTTGLLLFTAAVLFQFTSVHAQVAVESEHEVSTNPIIQIDPVAAELGNATGARGSFDAKNLVAADDNPDLFLDLACDQLKVTLLLDESGSILNRDGIEQVEDATMALANVLLGTDARLSIVEFENTARVIFNQVLVTDDVLNDLEAYLTGAGLNGETYDPSNDGLNLPCPVGNTNWEAGLDTTLFETDPNLLVFLTDGEPTSYSVDPGVNSCGYVVTGGSEPLNQAIAAANNLKGNGTHIFTYGVGNGIDVPNLQEVSGTENFADNPDIFTADYSTGSFEDLADNLSAGLNSICGTELLLTKEVNFTEICLDGQALVFTLTVENTGGSTDFVATEVLLSDTFPAAFTNLSISGAVPAGAELNGQVLTYDIGTLAVNESKTIQIEATFSGTNGTYTNVAYADASNALEVEDDATVTLSDEFSYTESIVSCNSYTVVPGDWVLNPSVPGEQILDSEESPFVVVIEGETESGCPKTVTLNVTVNEAEELPLDEITSCGPYEWDANDNGEYDPETEPTYTESGDYELIITNEFGLCQVATLSLTVEEVPETVEFEDTYCGPLLNPITFEVGYTPVVDGVDDIVWDGAPFTTSGVYTGTLSIEGSCDQTFIVYLTLNSDELIGEPCPLSGDEPGSFSGLTTADCGCEDNPTFDCPQLQANIGDACDDGDDNTENDMIDANCDCVGTIVYDCEDLQANIGDSCDDGDDNTENDMIDANCDCVGTIVYDCEDLQANIGDACDDGDDNTENDMIDANCDCVGTIVYDCEDLQANIGDACDDGDDNTENDMIDANCDCVGTIVYDCEDLQANIGDACDDGDDNTENDMIDANCDCVGTIVYDCEDLQANIGDTCDDGDDNTENDLIDANCGCAGTPIFECPDLQANNGDACETDLGQAGVIVDCACQPNNNPDVVDCDDWVTFLSDADGSGETDVYGVELVGGNANLTYLASVGYGAHIAYNSNDNLIYVVKNGDASYVTINPHVSPAEVSPVFFLSEDIPGVTTAVFSPDGDLIIGSASQNKIYSVDVSDNSVSLYDNFAPVSGGDLAFDEAGMLYLATRQGNALYEVYPDGVMNDVLIGSIPGQVTGMALSSDGRLVTSHNGNANLQVRNTDGSNPSMAYALMLDGEAFDHANGDMASGCNTFSDENEGDCENFGTFYSHFGNGTGVSGADIYSVLYSDNEAILTFLTNVPFGAHIAYNAEDDILYLVNPNGAFVRAYDPTSGTFLGDLPIVGSINSLFAVVYNPEDGLLYVGDDNDNEIYTIDLGTGQATFLADAPVAGGDLAIQDGKLYLANRSQGKLYEIVGGAAVLVGNIPAANGMAQANNATGLVIANPGTSSFIEVSAADGSEVNVYTATVDGEALTLSDGDMAAGCGDDEPVIVPGGECYAVAVEEYIEGTEFDNSPLLAERADPNNALGEPERVDALVFTTLGYGGSITVSFDGAIPNEAGDDIEVVETSYNNPGCASYPEYATVEVSMDGVNWATAGTVCKGDPFVDISDAGAFDYVMYVRVTNDDVLSTAMDGFDVDGIVALHNCEENGDGGQGVEDLLSVDSQNQLTSFPNPTNGAAQVVFVTAETGRTLVEVYDMNGRMVEALFNQEAEAGVEYRLDFNGTNLPNGVYIYRMTTENEVIVDKFMIAK